MAFQVMWEPFIEPWSFCLELIQYVNSGFPGRPDTTDVFLSSQQELNLNITEPVIEVPLFSSLLIVIFESDTLI